MKDRRVGSVGTYTSGRSYHAVDHTDVLATPKPVAQDIVPKEGINE